MSVRPAALAVILIGTCCASLARSQAVPFQFTQAPDIATRASALLRLDAAVGDVPFSAVDGAGGAGVLQGARLTAWFGPRVGLLARAMTSRVAGDQRWSTQLELRLRAVLRDRSAVALGVGARQEFDGATVLLANLNGATRLGRSSLAAGASLEHVLDASARGRDPVDLMTSLGWSFALRDPIHVGIEAVGQDLEGFWNPDEAEGGATIFAGPSMMLAPTGARWSLLLAAGRIFHASSSDRTSPAPRDFTTSNGYSVRAAFQLALDR